MSYVRAVLSGLWEGFAGAAKDTPTWAYLVVAGLIIWELIR